MANAKLISMFAELTRQQETRTASDLISMRIAVNADIEAALAVVETELDLLRDEIEALRALVKARHDDQGAAKQTHQGAPQAAGDPDQNEASGAVEEPAKQAEGEGDR